MLTVQVVDVPLQAPLQPENTEPVVGVAVSVTAVPCANCVEHVEPQLIPAGALVTVPEPEPSRVTNNVYVLRLNVAVTLRDSVMLTVQVPVPLQAPLQPEKLESAVALAVNVTLVPCAKSAEQALPQLIPAGLLVTVPDPDPDRVTDSACTCRANVAVTLRASLMLTVQVLDVPEHAPPQPENDDPAAALAVNVTLVPSANSAEQAAPQSMPAGSLTTDPVPEPVRETSIVCVSASAGAKAAVTLRDSVMLTVQVAAVPVHAPPQPANDDPAAALADNVTLVPSANSAEQAAPQSMPAGSLVTVPVPEPARATVNVFCAALASTVAMIASCFDGSKTLLAMISLVPGATPVTMPPLVTVATPGLTLSHSIAWLAPPRVSAVAVKACVAPTPTVMSPESIVTPTTLGSSHEAATNKRTNKDSAANRNLVDEPMMRLLGRTPRPTTVQPTRSHRRRPRRHPAPPAPLTSTAAPVRRGHPTPNPRWLSPLRHGAGAGPGGATTARGRILDRVHAPGSDNPASRGGIIACIP
jgi:hypothetical protein